MEKREDQWKELLQEQFAHYEAETERDLWPAIESQISQRSTPFYLWRSTWLVAASLVLLVGLIWVLSSSEQQPPIDYTTQQDPYQDRQPNPSNSQPTPSPPSSDSGNLNGQTGTSLAETTMLPTAPAPEILSGLADSQIAGPGEDPEASLSDGRTDSPLPPSRVIRQVGPMQPVMPDNLSDQLDDIPDLDAAERRMAPIAKAPVPNQRQAIDLNNLTLGDAVNFASSELGKLVKTPLQVYSEESEGDEVRTYQLELFNLRFTKKTHKKATQSSKL